MTNDLRDLLAITAARAEHSRAKHWSQTRDSNWEDMTASDQRSWIDYYLIDALLPVIYEYFEGDWVK